MPRLKVFISYRRDDFHQLAPGLVRGVHGRLEQHYGVGHVFMDIDAIQAGANFVTCIGSWVEKADVLLAVIGPQWAELIKARRRDPRDFVRIEIEAALRRGIPVVPVLMGGAKMPSARSLPTALADLVNLNAVTGGPCQGFHCPHGPADPGPGSVLWSGHAFDALRQPGTSLGKLPGHPLCPDPRRQGLVRAMAGPGSGFRAVRGGDLPDRRELEERGIQRAQAGSDSIPW